MSPLVKISYDKPHLPISAQILQLKSRGMTFENEERAKDYLTHINYYRLTSYWLPYKKRESEDFKENSSFEKVLKYYIFDRELRLLILDTIERIEVSVRTRMTYVLTDEYGSHPHLKEELYKCQTKYHRSIQKLEKECGRSKELFIRHFDEKYNEKLPPLWAVVELMTLGEISIWFSNIKSRPQRNKIAKTYNMDEVILSSYLHQLTHIRNICAHHGRLWNKKFMFTAKMPHYPENFSKSVNHDYRQNLYNILVFLKQMMDCINKNHQWNLRLTNLIERNAINIEQMGFPIDWKNLPIWIKKGKE